MIPRRAIRRYHNCPALEGHEDLDQDVGHTNKQRLEDSFTSLASPSSARTMPHGEANNQSTAFRHSNNNNNISDSFSTFASFASAPTTIQSHLKQRDTRDVSKKDAPSIAGATAATTVATSTTSKDDSLATASSSFATPSSSSTTISSFSSPSGGMRRRRGLAPSAREIRPSRLDNILVRNSNDDHGYEDDDDDDDVSLGFFSPTTGKRSTVQSTNASEVMGQGEVVVSVTPDLFELTGDDCDMDTTMNDVAPNKHYRDRDVNLNHGFAAWDVFGNNNNISADTLEQFHASVGSATPSFLSHQSSGKHSINSSSGSGSGSGGHALKTRHEMLDQRRKHTTTAVPPGDSSERSGSRTGVVSKSRSKRGNRSSDDKRKKNSDVQHSTSDNHTSRSSRTAASMSNTGGGIAFDEDENRSGGTRSRRREHRRGDHQEGRSKDHQRTRSKSIGRNEGKSKRESGHSKRRGRKVDKFLSEEEIDRLIGNCLTPERGAEHNSQDSQGRKDETLLSATKTTRRKHRSPSKSRRASPRSVLDVDAVEGHAGFSPVKPLRVKSCPETDFGAWGAPLDSPFVGSPLPPPPPPSSNVVDDEDPFSTPIIHNNRKVPLSPVQTGSKGGRSALSSSAPTPRKSRADLSSSDKAERPPRPMDNKSRMDLGKPVHTMVASQQTNRFDDPDFTSAVASPRRQLSGRYELRRSTVSKMRSNDARQRKGQVLDSLSTFL